MLSIWQGASADSWFNFDKLTRYRILKNPEFKASNRINNFKGFYLISWDVARLHDESVVCIFRVIVDSNGVYKSTLVNIIVLGLTPEEKVFSKQVIAVKRLIALFNPREVVIDTNGLGIGVGELMTQTQIDEQGVSYPAYGFNNDEQFMKVQPQGIPKILYGIKANATLKSKIHSNVYTRIANGLVHFLTKEQDAKIQLLSTKIGQHMNTVERVKRIMPHQMTTSLFNQMANLKIKQSGTNDIVLEPINSHYPDDKYMSFAYGLWRIKELEEENAPKFRRSSGKRKLTFFTEGSN